MEQQCVRYRIQQIQEDSLAHCPFEYDTAKSSSPISLQQFDSTVFMILFFIAPYIYCLYQLFVCGILGYPQEKENHLLQSNYDKTVAAIWMKQDISWKGCWQSNQSQEELLLITVSFVLVRAAGTQLPNSLKSFGKVYLLGRFLHAIFHVSSNFRYQDSKTEKRQKWSSLPPPHSCS